MGCGETGLLGSCLSPVMVSGLVEVSILCCTPAPHFWSVIVYIRFRGLVPGFQARFLGQSITLPFSASTHRF